MIGSDPVTMDVAGYNQDGGAGRDILLVCVLLQGVCGAEKKNDGMKLKSRQLFDICMIKASDVAEDQVQFASKTLTPRRMH